MSELRELYQEVILDHGKSPRNFGRPATVTGESHGHNPLCGDTITIYLDVEDGVIKDVGFEGRGCAISMASASMMTDMLRGKSVKEVEVMFKSFHGLVAPQDAVCAPGFQAPELDKLIVLAGVREFPMRVKCATLPWHTMKAALKGESEEISTE
jgi:nitrogen fixation NifU-like protein